MAGWWGVWLKSPFASKLNHQLNIPRFPGLVKPRLQRPVEAQDGAPTLQRIENGRLLTSSGTLWSICESHVNLLWCHDGGAQYGGRDRSGLPALRFPKQCQLAIAGTTKGWEFEVFMPWTMFNAYSGGQRRNGDE